MTWNEKQILKKYKRAGVCKNNGRCRCQ